MGNVETIGWKKVKTTRLAMSLIDRGILLPWSDIKRLHSRFSHSEQLLLIRYFAINLAKPNTSHVHREKTVESLLIWLEYSRDDSLVQAFVEQSGKMDFHTLVRDLTFITLSQDIFTANKGNNLYSMGISLVCELGNYLNNMQVSSKKQRKKKEALGSYVATYLLSVSNINHEKVRLSLFSYFSSICHTESGGKFFNKIMHRFGYTVLDYLFSQLFNKKSEAMALEYLFRYLPKVLHGKHFTHKTLHLIFRCLMYRYPDRFTLFLRTFTEQMLVRWRAEGVMEKKVSCSWFKHLVFLYPLVSEMNRRNLVPEFLEMLRNFTHSEFHEKVLDELQGMDILRPYFAVHLTACRDNLYSNEGKVIPLGAKITKKRGRRPALAKVSEPVSTCKIILFLTQKAEQSYRKAS